MKEAKPSEGKRVHPLTKIGYFLLTQGNRYANSFILLAGFALSGAFFVLGGALIFHDWAGCRSCEVTKKQQEGDSLLFF